MYLGLKLGQFCSSTSGMSFRHFFIESARSITAITLSCESRWARNTDRVKTAAAAAVAVEVALTTH